MFKKTVHFRKKENFGASLRSMSNQGVVSLNNLSRLAANNGDWSQSPFNLSAAFYVEHDTSNGYSISLRSLQNDLFVCLDGEKLGAFCNESIKDQRRDDFTIKCFSHWRGNFRHNADCNVFFLYSQTAKKAITVDQNKQNVLKVSFYIISKIYFSF